MINEQDLKAILDAAKEDARHSLAEYLQNAIEHDVRTELRQQIRALVTKYIEDEIVPEIGALLTSSKGEILNAANEAAKEIGVILAAGMIKDATNNLSKDWERRDILKALFK